MCIFCEIVKGAIPSNKVLENNEFIALHDLYPKAPVHILIIPKLHVACFQDTPADMMAKMTPFIQEVARVMGLDKGGYRLTTNNGDDGGQEIYHLHFHLMGGAKLPFEHRSDETHNSI